MATHVSRLIALGVVFAAGMVAGQWMGEPSVAAQAPGKVFELRTYTSPPGKLNDLHARFRGHTLELFEKHGMTNIGYWVPVDQKTGEANGNALVYILAYPSLEARQKSWDAFRSDPEWDRVRTASETNGRLVEKVDSLLLKATDYSKIK